MNEPVDHVLAGFGPLTDAQIRYRIGRPADCRFRLRILPFQAENLKVRAGRAVIGSGLSCVGYDITLGSRFKPVGMMAVRDGDGPLRLEPWAIDREGYPITAQPTIWRDERERVYMDPKNPGMAFGQEFETDKPFDIPPHGCILGETVEYFHMPEDTLAFVVGKSTLARCFENINATILEPGWVGTATLEIANLTALPLRVYPGEGTGQVVFMACTEFPDTPYNRQRNAAYQHQSGPTMPRAGNPVEPAAG